MVMQESLLFYGTVEETFAGEHKRIRRDHRTAAADAWTSSIRFRRGWIPSWATGKISPADRRGLNLARTFIKRPDILILDDSTSAMGCHRGKDTGGIKEKDGYDHLYYRPAHFRHCRCR